MSRLMPRQPVPALSVPTLDGEPWELAARSPERFSMLVVYRGVHCPVCRSYVPELDRLLGDFNERGVDVLVLSSDTEERARMAQEQWKLKNLTIGYGLTIESGREWGLYVSTSRGKTSIGIEEPALFTEPGLFLVRPDGTLYWGVVQTMPFARPHFKEILAGVDFAIKVDYPARGEA
ncbi:MAG: AhpC/TSA family protein [Gammaproteobacteria bacterium]|nr:AhpC/TSA family protein [Gammaproteobacteria bacterium]